MSINQIKVELNQDTPVSRLDKLLQIGGGKNNKNMGIKKVHIRFNNSFHVEVKQGEKPEDVIVVITAGGVSKEIDLPTFRQLITMNY